MPTFPATSTTKSVLVCIFLQFALHSATFTYCNGRPRPRRPGCVRLVPGGCTTFSRKDLPLLSRECFTSSVLLREVIRRGYTFPPHKLVRDDCRWIMFHNVEVWISQVFTSVAHVQFSRKLLRTSCKTQHLLKWQVMLQKSTWTFGCQE